MESIQDKLRKRYCSDTTCTDGVLLDAANCIDRLERELRLCNVGYAGCRYLDKLQIVQDIRTESAVFAEHTPNETWAKAYATIADGMTQLELCLVKSMAPMPNDDNQEL